jgi:diaminopimelate decarboxylase
MSITRYLSYFNQLKTPFYFYDTDLLKNTLNSIVSASSQYNYKVHYALKANVNNKVLNEICKYGFGADCVSGNEIKKAIELNFKPNDIVFAGVGKTDEEIEYALSKNIFCFNCESAQEIQVLNGLAEKHNKTAPVALRINPGVNPNTHKYITTGLDENKFGINRNQLDQTLEIIQQSKSLRLIGLHFHIGSQITDMQAFKNLCTRINEIQQWFISRNFISEHINVGGGFGIDYHNPDENPIPDFNEYFSLFNKFLELRPKQQVHFELGRAIVAQCGNLITRVLYTKEGNETNFIIVDAGMTELIRPALYQAYHKIENLSKKNKSEYKYDVVGPICESSDCFGKSVFLPETKRGDIIAIRSAGAYGQVMTSFYNLREKAEAYYSDEIL